MFNILLPKDISEDPLWKAHNVQQMTLSETTLKHWMKNVVFSPVWWLMLVTFIVMWSIWWRLVNKARLMEIVTYGLLIAMSSIIIDIIAIEYVLWGYPNNLTPTGVPILLIDLGILPVVYMLIYQYFTSWKSFSIATFITAFFLAFMMEPAAAWLDIIELNSWSYIYSYPTCVLKAFSLKWVMNIIIAKQDHSLLEYK